MRLTPRCAAELAGGGHPVSPGLSRPRQDASRPPSAGCGCCRRAFQQGVEQERLDRGSSSRVHRLLHSCRQIFPAPILAPFPAHHLEISPKTPGRSMGVSIENKRPAAPPRWWATGTAPRSPRGLRHAGACARSRMSFETMSLAFSPIMMAGALVFPDTILGHDRVNRRR